MKIIPFPLKKPMSVKKLHDDLDYWIMIGIGDDIVEIPNQRKEYRLLVQKYRGVVDADLIPKVVLRDLKEELKKPLLLQKTFYWLLWLEFRKIFS